MRANSSGHIPSPLLGASTDASPQLSSLPSGAVLTPAGTGSLVQHNYSARSATTASASAATASVETVSVLASPFAAAAGGGSDAAAMKSPFAAAQ